ncbi:Asr1405/Asl0597 family protein [Leptothermofonsia sp. ETS-13]|uniref:Asr1405/Asl0597 family protein n=1 Tax=Leptothermofonsia sp. ETS-13 TaxID=3035696 RepID=UPI003BA194D4
MNHSQLESLTVQVFSVSRCDRWQARERLQALSIPCHCTADGCLVVEINSPLAVIQLKSVVQQLTASRAELVNWLENCWEMD